MNIMLLEDNANELAELRYLIEKWLARTNHTDCELSDYREAESFMANFEQINPEIVFIDIFIEGEEAGIKVAQEVHRLNPRCAIIITTTSRDYALQGFAINAINYCIKPITAEMIDECFGRCFFKFEHADQLVHLKAGRDHYELNVSSILYARSDDHYLEFYLVGHEQPVTVRLRMSEAEEKLSDPRFLKTNRSFIVNMDYVESLGNEFLTLRGGKRIPLRRQERNDLRDRYQNYIFGRMRSPHQNDLAR